jgi:hypothetical protein
MTISDMPLFLDRREAGQQLAEHVLWKRCRALGHALAIAVDVVAARAADAAHGARPPASPPSAPTTDASAG